MRADGVERRRGVALGQHEAVAMRIVDGVRPEIQLRADRGRREDRRRTARRRDGPSLRDRSRRSHACARRPRPLPKLLFEILRRRLRRLFADRSQIQRHVGSCCARAAVAQSKANSRVEKETGASRSLVTVMNGPGNIPVTIFRHLALTIRYKPSVFGNFRVLQSRARNRRVQGFVAMITASRPMPASASAR